MHETGPMSPPPRIGGAERDYDVAVVGAGPAGSAAALRVLRDSSLSRVLLLDSARFPRDKTCGDGVIGADGVNSTIHRLLGAPVAPLASTAVAVRGYTSTSTDPGAMTIEFAAGRYPAYAWSFPLSDGRAAHRGVFDAAVRLGLGRGTVPPAALALILAHLAGICR